MRKDLPTHTVQLVQFQSTTEMKDRTNVPDKLSTYGQDDLLQSVFVAREMPVELESENRFLHSVLGYL
jgi:hypothetical protein